MSCYAPRSNRDCAWIDELDGIGATWVGDALAPRTVEEAILEGLRAARAL